MCIAFFVLLSETAQLPSTTVACFLVLPAAPVLWSPRSHRSAIRTGTGDRGVCSSSGGGDDARREEYVARQVPAQRGVAGLLAWPAAPEQAARGRARAAKPAGVSHVSTNTQSQPLPVAILASPPCAAPAHFTLHKFTGILPERRACTCVSCSRAAEPSPLPSTCGRRGDTMERLDKAALNALQHPEFR